MDAVNLELVRDGKVQKVGAKDTVMREFFELGGARAGYSIRPWGEAPAPAPKALPYAEWVAGDTVLMRSVAHGDKLVEVNFRGWHGDMGVVVHNGMQMSTHRSTLYHINAEGVERWTPPVKAAPPAPPVVEARPTPTGTVTRTVAAGKVSAEAAARVARHEAALAAMGIALPPPVYAPGSVVNGTGVANFALSRQAWERSPETSPACADIAAAIRAEDRRDVVVPMRELLMADDGSLAIPGEGPLWLEGAGFDGLVPRMRRADGEGPVFPAGGQLLRAMDPELRSEVWNRMAMARGAADKLRLRTRQHDGARTVFAVVSPSYSPMDADIVADTLAGAFRGEATRGEVVYDPARAELRVDALYHADRVVDLAAGDVFKVGLRFRTSDSGGGAIRCEGTALRNRCLNLIILGSGEVELFRQVHKGDLRGVPAAIGEAARKGIDLFRGFAEEWGALRATPIDAVTLWGQEFADVEAAIRHGAEHGLITEAVARDTLVEILLSGWRAEPGETLADLVNAMTRAAHEAAASMVDDCARSVMERDAGRLVHVLAQTAAEA